MCNTLHTTLFFPISRREKRSSGVKRKRRYSGCPEVAFWEANKRFQSIYSTLDFTVCCMLLSFCSSHFLYDYTALFLDLALRVYTQRWIITDIP